jgi:hypothetical protein
MVDLQLRIVEVRVTGLAEQMRSAEGAMPKAHGARNNERHIRARRRDGEAAVVV